MSCKQRCLILSPRHHPYGIRASQWHLYLYLLHLNHLHHLRSNLLRLLVLQATLLDSSGYAIPPRARTPPPSDSSDSGWSLFSGSRWDTPPAPRSTHSVLVGKPAIGKSILRNDISYNKILLWLTLQLIDRARYFGFQKKPQRIAGCGACRGH